MSLVRSLNAASRSAGCLHSAASLAAQQQRASEVAHACINRSVRTGSLTSAALQDPQGRSRFDGWRAAASTQAMRSSALLFPRLLQHTCRSTAIEYKYVIRAGEGEVKAVVQWQPCNNLEVQAAAAQEELTIRDAWEGEQHEVLPGTLPLPAPPATEPEPQPAEEETPAALTQAVAVEEPAAAPVVAEAAAAPEAVPQVVAAAAPIAVEAPEPVKAAEGATPAAAPGPRRRRSTTTSRSANGNSKPVNGSNGSRKVVAAATTEVRAGAMPAHK